MLSHCEFQLIKNTDGQILGRLYHPSKPFNVSGSKRNIHHISHEGRCIVFDTDIEDMLGIRAIAKPSYSAAARIQTNKLVMELKRIRRQQQRLVAA